MPEATIALNLYLIISNTKMNTNSIYSYSVALTTAIACSYNCSFAQNKDSKQSGNKKQNILYIIVDDLRTELNCYGANHAVSPNIDALAAEGTLFSRAYCNIPVSGASRASIMTGTRPTRNTFSDFDAVAAIEKPEIETLNDYFKSQGYTTIALGKVFHNPQDHASSWDRVEQNSFLHYLSPHNIEIGKKKTSKRGYAYECTDTNDDLHSDGETAMKAMNQLEALQKSDRPFFLALGFLRPHLPFIAPKKYWDMYDYSQITVPDNYVMPDNHGIPSVAFPNWGELRKYTGIPEEGALAVDSARMLIHGYKASVSFTDAQIGRVMAKLKSLGLDKNTAIVLVGDHGWNLGEHGVWCKHTIFETSLHAPLIIVDPTAKIKGNKTDQVVEFVDIYPTICDMGRLTKPTHLEGESLMPLLNSKKAKSKGYAICRWNKGFTLITTDNLFYTEWWDAADRVTNRLLFDHRIDAKENKNLVENPRYASRLKALSTQLKAKRGENFDKYPAVKSTKSN